MSYGTACFSIGNHDLTVTLTADCFPAEPAVGIWYDTYEIVECSVTRFDDFKRDDHVGCDENWHLLDNFVLQQLTDNPKLHDIAILDASENAAGY
jgi:hypothetical protein